MPVPTNITDLSTTAGSNSPAGTESIGTNADDYIRAHAAFIAALRDGSKNTALGSVGAPAIAFTGDLNTGIYSPGADQVGIAAGGATTVAITATGLSVTGTLAVSGAFSATSVTTGQISATAITSSGLIKGNGGGSGLGAITISTSAASGGSSGDLWFRY